MKRNFLRILFLLEAVVFSLSLVFNYAQVKEPFPKPSKLISKWKITRFYTEPSCYTKLPDRDNRIIINATFECTSLSCKELTIKAYWSSSIEHVVKKINLTEAVNKTCGSHATSCRIIWDGEPVKVIISPKKYTISTFGYISPRLTGDIKLALEAYTGVGLTDKKTIVIEPCSREQPKPEIKPDLVIEKFQIPETVIVKKGEYADIKINLTIKNAGRGAITRVSYVDVEFSPTPPGRAVRHRKSIPALNPGEIYTLNSYIRIAPRNYRVCAIVDSTNVVIESNEGNNKECRSLAIKVK